MGVTLYLKKAAGIVWSRRLFLSIAALAVMILVFVCCLVFGGPRYETEGMLYLVPENQPAAEDPPRSADTEEGGGGDAAWTASSNIAHLTWLTQIYCGTLSSDAMMSAVSAALHNTNHISITPEVLGESLRLRCEGNVVYFSAVSDKQASADQICTALLRCAPSLTDPLGVLGSVRAEGEVLARRQLPAVNAISCTLISGLCALAAAALLALFWEACRGVVRDGIRAARKLKLPLLGILPHETAVQGEEASDPLLSAFSSPMLRKAYEELRTNLFYGMAKANGNMILVSSGDDSEADGSLLQSTAAANLAYLFGQTTARVLLIDGDLRNPVLHSFWNLGNTHGLSRFLTGAESLAAALKRDVLPCVDFIASGLPPENPSELLGSKNMQLFLDKIQDYYDYIIINAPSVHACTDAAVLSGLAAGTVLIVRADATKTEALRRAAEKLRCTEAHLLGFAVID